MKGRTQSGRPLSVADTPDARSEAGAEEAVSRSVRLLLAVIASTVFVTTLTGSMVTVVLPLMRDEFDATAAQIGWVITGFALAYAVGVPLHGRISDTFGVRRVFCAGILGFAIGGLICALAPSLPILVLGRFVQGAGGAAVPALATITVAKTLPSGNRGTAMGLVASSVGIGSAVGPLVGGGGGQFLGWRALFVGSVVLMLLLVPFALHALPDGSSEGERRFDLIGGLLLGMASGLFLFGITRGQEAGFAAASSWGSCLAATVTVAGFIWRINVVPDPFVVPRLFRNRAYVSAGLVGYFAMFAYLSALVFVSLLVVEENGLNLTAAGLVLTPGAVALAIFSPLAGRYSDRVGVRLPVVAGLGIMALAVLWISTVAGSIPELIAIGMVGVGAGFAFIQAPTNNAAANALRTEDVGGGMGLVTGAFFLGGGTGPAMIGALLTTRQDARSGAINPLYSFDAAPFSDAFLALAIVLILGLVAAFGLRNGTDRSAPM